jgi:hypothetical protein
MRISSEGDSIMKRFRVLAAACIIALPVIAAEPKSEEPKKSEPETAAAEASKTVAPADSPLVAAAKKANRFGKKRIVITNDDLKKDGGRIMTSTNSGAPVYIPRSSPSQTQQTAQAPAQSKTEQAGQSDAAAKQRVSATAEENSLYDEAPPERKPEPKKEEKKP